jgi:lactate permease
MYRQILDPVAGSLGWSSLFASLPLLTLFVLLGVLRVRVWLAAFVALAVALGIAVLVYPMPVGQALLSGSEGAAFGFFPIMWIVINAIWIYSMTVQTGHFDLLRRSFARVSDDQRIQAVIIAFCFGALLEALAGFGTPVAITSVMLMALGFRPLKAATVALVANTAPVAFGAIAVPITTLATVTGLDQDRLGAMVGRQSPVLALLVPLALVAIVDGRRGVRQVWPAAIVCGAAFAVAQFYISNEVSVPLTDIVAALVGAAATVVLLRFWRPEETYVEEPTVEEPTVEGPTGRSGAGPVGAGGGEPVTVSRAVGAPVRSVGGVTGDGGNQARLDVAAQGTLTLANTRREITRAYAPYLIIIVVFVVAQVPVVKDVLASATAVFHWPGLDLHNPAGKSLSLQLFTLNWLAAGGTLLFVAGLVTVPVLGLSAGEALRAYLRTYRQLATAIITVMAVLALAYVMNAAGQTATLGTWMAGAGGVFAVLSPVIGWLGVAVTGSDTSSNSLFGALQVTAANHAGLNPLLMAASNSSGGVLGKMISPQNLAIAGAAVGLGGREGDLFRRVFGWSVLFLALMCALVALQATPVLSWMIP